VTRPSRPAVAAAGAFGAVTARGAYAALRAAPTSGDERWARTNHRGEPVTLLAGPAAAAGAGLGALLAPGPPAVRLSAAGVAGLAGAVGAYDDLLGTSGDKGFAGHLAALRQGRVTSGLVKVAAIGLGGLVAGTAVRWTPTDRLLAGAVVAGSANLVNLLDLRPGRAAKACLLAAGPALLVRAVRGSLADPDGVTAAALGAAAALLPDDLAERTMLGDAGANALGAALGVAAAARTDRRGLLVRAGLLVALTAASERVSFTRVIDRVPPLHAIDRLGRAPAAATPA
jgi:UDP-GlcNAc:undecaprenyl-phosphate GlcNAc-1-phosphate transferase